MKESLSKGDQARADILAAARELFLSNGFHGTSMRAIAQAAGNRAVAGIYNHFPTKEAIFAALIEEGNPYDELFPALEQALAGARTGPEFVRRALHTVLGIMTKHYSFVQLAQIDLREFDGQTVAHMLQTQVLPRLGALIGQLQALPGMKPIEPLVWIRTMASLIIGFITTEQIISFNVFGERPREESIDALADIVLYGMAAEPAPEKE